VCIKLSLVQVDSSFVIQHIGSKVLRKHWNLFRSGKVKTSVVWDYLSKFGVMIYQKKR